MLEQKTGKKGTMVKSIKTQWVVSISIFVVTGIIMVGIVNGWWDYSYSSPSQKSLEPFISQSVLESKIIPYLKDPKSFEVMSFKQYSTDSIGVVGVELVYRSKNSFGGYVVDAIQAHIIPTPDGGIVTRTFDGENEVIYK